MAEEDPKPLNHIPEVILKKRKSSEASQLQSKNTKETKDIIKKPEDLSLENRNMELDNISKKPRVERKQPELLTLKSKPLLIIRIQGKKDMLPNTIKVLYILGLRRVSSAVFVKPTERFLAFLRRLEPFVTYGYPNLNSITKLLYKKGRARIDNQKVPLTDNNIIEQELGKFGIVSIEDMAHQIDNLGPHFKEVIRFMWPFQLNKPAEGLKGSKTSHKDGGDTGNREDPINELINKMNQLMS